MRNSAFQAVQLMQLGDDARGDLPAHLNAVIRRLEQGEAAQRKTASARDTETSREKEMVMVEPLSLFMKTG